MKIIQNIFTTIGIAAVIAIIAILLMQSQKKEVVIIADPDMVASRLGVVFNQYREANDLNITMGDVLSCDFAQDRLEDMEHSFSHDLFDETIDQYAVEYTNVARSGENLYSGPINDGRKIFDVWLTSPTHKLNIDNPKWDKSCFQCNTEFCVHVFIEYK